jgi:putative addiction module killer protein
METQFSVTYYVLKNGKSPFRKWLHSLSPTTRIEVIRRIGQIYQGHFGTFEALGDNLYELKFYKGPGYRVYYTIQNHTVVIILAGGDKSTQTNDIKKAKTILKTLMEDKTND